MDEQTTQEPAVDDQVAQARRLLAEHEERRMQACLAEISTVLDKYGMNLSLTPARIMLTPRGQ